MRKILDDNALLVVATGFAVLLTLLTLGAPKAQQTASGTDSHDPLIFRGSRGVNFSVESHSIHIGLGSTLVALSVPDTLLSVAGRFVFALITAVATSLISRLITDTFKRKP